MVRNLPYFAARAARSFTLTLLLACAADDGSTEDARDSVENTAAGGSKQADPNAGSGDESAGDFASEPPLDPGRVYPAGGAVARDASSATSKPAVAPPSGDVALSEPAPPRDTSVGRQPVNPFVDASKDPFSTFGADVDTASYDFLRQSLMGGRLPGSSYVRAEEFINYFQYDYPKPAVDAAQPFQIALAAMNHPMRRATTLLRVGIQAKAPPPSEKKPAHIVFLVDVSGSMASQDKLPLVKRVLEEGLKALAPTDKVSIVSYASDTRVRLPPTVVSARDSIVAQIQSLSADGSTDGGSGINLAYEQASAGFIQGGINHVILCTDGDFNVGITSNEALLALIKQKRATGVTLTALGFGSSRINDAMMEKVSNAGNGSYSIIYSKDQAIEYANERLLATIVHVAKDMKIQVEFNPAQVKAYRLIGYEDRAIADGSFRDDAVDGGEVGADHRVTALYELVLADKLVPMVPGAPPLSAGDTSELAREVQPNELVRVKVRSKAVTATDADPAMEVVQSLTPMDVAATADRDSAWAAAVASVAELLRGSPYSSRNELEVAQQIVDEQKTRDGDRAEFATLLGKIRTLLAVER